MPLTVGQNPTPYQITGLPADTQAKLTTDQVATGVAALSAQMTPAEAALFKTVVSDAAALTPNGAQPEMNEAELETLAGAVEKLNALSVSGSTIDTLARAIITQQGQQRHQAVQDRVQMKMLAMSEAQASAGELNKQADTMKSSATTQLVMGVVGSAASMAGSGLALGMAGKGASKAVKGAEKAEEGASKELGKLGKLSEMATSKVVELSETKVGQQLTKTSEKVGEKLSELKETKLGKLASKAGSIYEKMTDSDEKLLHTTGAVKDLFGGVGKGFESGGGYAGTSGQADGKRNEAASKLDDATAQYLDGQAELKDQVVKNVTDMMQQTVQLLKDLQDAKAERMAAFTRV